MRDTVRNAGFLPDAVAVVAVGHLTDLDGACRPSPWRPTSPCRSPRGAQTSALATEAGGGLVTVCGHWHDAADGPGRLQVESLEMR